MLCTRVRTKIAGLQSISQLCLQFVRAMDGSIEEEELTAQRDAAVALFKGIKEKVGCLIFSLCDVGAIYIEAATLLSCLLNVVKYIPHAANLQVAWDPRLPSVCCASHALLCGRYLSRIPSFSLLRQITQRYLRTELLL